LETKRCERCGGWLAKPGEELSTMNPDYGLDPICVCLSQDLDEIDRILAEEDL
jgi:hypothetical protein